MFFILKKLNKIFKNRNLVISVLLVFLYSTTLVFATPPGSPYAPGATLDPSCAPGDVNCTVGILDSRDEGSSLTYQTTALNFVGSGVTATEASGVITVTVPGGLTDITIGSTPLNSGTVGRILFEGSGNVFQESANLFWDQPNSRLGVGDDTPNSLFTVGSGDLFQVDSSGDLIKIKNVTYSWPSSNTSGVLTNNGSGSLSWSTNGNGDVLNEGNTLGAAMTIGTNDTNVLNLETNNITRASVTGGVSTGGAWTFDNITTNTSTVQDFFTIRTNSTGTPAVGFGSSILFQGESDTTSNRDMIRLSSDWRVATDASRSSRFYIYGVDSASSLTEFARIYSSASVPVMTFGGGSTLFYNGGISATNSLSISNSSSALTLGGGTGAINILNSGTSNINIYNTSNTATTSSSIVFGNSLSATQTSGTRDYLLSNVGFAPTSGTAVHNSLTFSGTFNQTGGANGITRGLYLNQTLTAVADFRGIDISYSNANAKGIYQSGSLTTNYFAGFTGFGDTSPDYLLDVETNTASSYAANFFNDGNDANRGGVVISSGLDDHTAAGPSTLILFQDGDQGTVGSITFGSSVTAYNTTSDERLKENIIDTTLSLYMLNQIKIRDFTWKGDSVRKVAHGVIAQELNQVYPGAVTVPIKNTEPWMVDYSKLTPLVIKSIQDLDLKVKDIEFLYEQKEQSLGMKITEFLSDMSNSIIDLYAQTINTEKIKTKELCVGSVCVTEEEFLRLINDSNKLNNNVTDGNSSIETKIEIDNPQNNEILVESGADLVEPMVYETKDSGSTEE